MNAKHNMLTLVIHIIFTESLLSLQDLCLCLVNFNTFIFVFCINSQQFKFFLNIPLQIASSWPTQNVTKPRARESIVIERVKHSFCAPQFHSSSYVDHDKFINLSTTFPLIDFLGCSKRFVHFGARGMEENSTHIIFFAMSAVKKKSRTNTRMYENFTQQHI